MGIDVHPVNLFGACELRISPHSFGFGHVSLPGLVCLDPNLGYGILHEIGGVSHCLGREPNFILSGIPRTPKQILPVTLVSCFGRELSFILSLSLCLSFASTSTCGLCPSKADRRNRPSPHVSKKSEGGFPQKGGAEGMKTLSLSLSLSLSFRALAMSVHAAHAEKQFVDIDPHGNDTNFWPLYPDFEDVPRYVKNKRNRLR